MDIEFRPIPSLPGYSASLCGVIRRDKPYVDGRPFMVKIRAAVSPYVQIASKALPVDRLVAEAWGDLAPPVTSRRHRTPAEKLEIPKGPRGGRYKTITWEQYRLILRARRLAAELNDQPQ